MADRRLQVFHALAKRLSVTNTADVLFMTRPAVTCQIKQLEEHFNTRLFARGQGKIALTPKLIRTLSLLDAKEKLCSRLLVAYVAFAGAKLKQLSLN